jgi:hypothetical protein
MSDGKSGMSSREMIRVSLCYTMFNGFVRAFGIFLKDVQLHKLMEKHGLTTKDKHTVVELLPLTVTEKTTKEAFEIRCASTHTGCKRCMEFERI